uniref:Uncharacterized protein n=1 Tax=Oryza punctata TaxID=4537 RepID=A0A0E0M1Z7_ORYPU
MVERSARWTHGRGRLGGRVAAVVVAPALRGGRRVVDVGAVAGGSPVSTRRLGGWVAVVALAQTPLEQTQRQGAREWW